MVQFQNPNHARIFVICMTTLGVGTYFSPTLYRAFYLPRKLAREREEALAKEAAELAAAKSAAGKSNVKDDKSS